MADFKTHITVSSALGVAYGAVAYQQFGMPAPTCVLAGALCGVSGMLPDLDSDSGVPLRESMAFTAACVPMLLVDRLRTEMDWTPETIVLAGVGVYAAIRFGLSRALKKFTVHRGMFHSLPAAAIVGLIAFLLASGMPTMRIYKALAVVAGFMSHLILDEIYSVKVGGTGIALKSSFGTAVKLWGSSGWANLVCYGLLAAVGLVALQDPIWSSVSPEADRLHTIATKIGTGIEERTHIRLPNGQIKLIDTTANGGHNAPPDAMATNLPPPNYAPPQYVPQPNGPIDYGSSQYGATIYAQPNYTPRPQLPPANYGAPIYESPPSYGAPQPYNNAPGYSYPQPYAPPQNHTPQPYSTPYVQPYVPPYQASGPASEPYVSPRY